MNRRTFFTKSAIASAIVIAAPSVLAKKNTDQIVKVSSVHHEGPSIPDSNSYGSKHFRLRSITNNNEFDMKTYTERVVVGDLMSTAQDTFIVIKTY